MLKIDNYKVIWLCISAITICIFIFLVVLLFNCLCDKSVRFTIEKLQVSSEGLIECKYWDYGEGTITGWLRTNTAEIRCGSATGNGSGLFKGNITGNITQLAQTDDVLSVRFFVKEGESFEVPPGGEKTLFQYSQLNTSSDGKIAEQKETVSYVIKVRGGQ